MLHNPKRDFTSVRTLLPPAVEARRLRLEYNRLQRQRRLAASVEREFVDSEAGALLTQIERIARELGLIRADSVHAVESKLRVALDMMADGSEEASHKLLSSALADLHYLALMSEPKRA